MHTFFVLFIAAAFVYESVGDQHAEGYKDYTGHSVVRITPEDDSHTHFLQSLKDTNLDGVEFWKDPGFHRKNVDIHLSPEKKDFVHGLLRERRIPHTTIIDDLQSLIRNEGRSNRVKRSVEEENQEDSEGHIPPFNHTYYHFYDEISDWLDAVGRTCGNLCSVFSIGKSSENRDLKVIRIGEESPNKPIIWIDAGIHAREWIAPATALYIISRLLETRSSRLMRYLNSKYTWYILPLANPDGYTYTWTHQRLWRKTRSVHPTNSCRGVDPNRNFGFHWAGEGTSSNPCSENYHGIQPFSEPETQAMSQFILSLGDKLAVYLSFHSYGQYWLTPWGFTDQRVPDDYLDMLYLGNQAANALKRVHGTDYEVGASSRMLYIAAGGSDDWVKGVAGVKYAYTVELRDTGRHGFILPASHIEPSGREMLRAVSVLALNVLRERRLQERQQISSSLARRVSS